QMTDFRLGFEDGVETNVESPAGLPELKKFDDDRQYARKKSKLYRANLNAKLPGADADLDYNLASLAAPVKAFASQSHLMLAGYFKNQSEPELPSAVKVQLIVSVTTKLGAPTKNTVSVTACAAGSGALDERAIRAL